MKTAQHTPGSWTPEPHYGNAAQAIYIQQPDERENGGWVVATCWGQDKEANARLIAAAPDLLSELESVLAYLGSIAETKPDDLSAYLDNSLETVEGRIEELLAKIS